MLFEKSVEPQGDSEWNEEMYLTFSPSNSQVKV